MLVCPLEFVRVALIRSFSFSSLIYISICRRRDPETFNLTKLTPLAFITVIMLRIFSVLAALSTLLPTTTGNTSRSKTRCSDRLLSADPTDWVNVQYFASKSSTYRSGQTTARNAEQAVVQGAASASKRAPFSK